MNTDVPPAVCASEVFMPQQCPTHPASHGAIPGSRCSSAQLARGPSHGIQAVGVSMVFFGMLAVQGKEGEAGEVR